MTSGNGIYGRECKKTKQKKKHGLVNTNLLSVLFIDTIIHMLQDLLQYECSVVYRGGDSKPMLEQCGYSVAKTAAQQKFTLTVGWDSSPGHCSTTFSLACQYSRGFVTKKVALW